MRRLKQRLSPPIKYAALTIALEPIKYAALSIDLGPKIEYNTESNVLIGP